MICYSRFDGIENIVSSGSALHGMVDSALAGHIGGEVILKPASVGMCTKLIQTV